MRLRTTLLTVSSFAVAAVISAFVAGGSATVIELRSRLAMRVAMEAEGLGWVRVETDGLQVILSGTAPSEADRLRALTRAGTAIDPKRIADDIDVASAKAVAPPDFSLRMLRNDDGISLIGLVPAATNRQALVSTLEAALAAQGGTVTDMLEAADYPEPDGWQEALDFAVQTLRTLPRAKISVDPGKVDVQAIADSPAEKSRLETSLARRRPEALKLTTEISAPRPVIAPFTLRFLIDSAGPRFDACSADSDRARDRILAAARAAGAKGALSCTIGIGTPSPQWSDAVVLGIRALSRIGSGVITFSDTDVFLSANPDVPRQTLDAAVGELESNLPAVFSLRSELQHRTEATNGAPEFSAQLSKSGKVEISGPVGDARARSVVESLAQAKFGADAVHSTMRVTPNLPQGWPKRSLVAIEALGLMASGELRMTPDSLTLTGVTGDSEARDTVSRMLTAALGGDARISLDIRYDPKLDPSLGLPDGPQCVTRLNDVLAQHKIGFEPGSAKMSGDAQETLDDLAQAMKNCQDFPMEVAGHTDAQGSAEGNLALSQSRADAVVASLQARRVLTANLTAKGYGKDNPIATNDTEEGREANRRIEFSLIAPPQDSAAPDAVTASPAPLPKPALPALQSRPQDAVANDVAPVRTPSAAAPEAAPTATPPAAPATDEGGTPSMDEAPMEDGLPESGPSDNGPMDAAPMDDHGPMEASDAPETGADTAMAPATTANSDAGSEADAATDAPAADPSAQASPPASAGPEAPGTDAATPDTALPEQPAVPEAGAAPSVEITPAGVEVRDAALSPKQPKPRPAQLKRKKSR